MKAYLASKKGKSNKAKTGIVITKAIQVINWKKINERHGFYDNNIIKYKTEDQFPQTVKSVGRETVKLLKYYTAINLGM